MSRKRFTSRGLRWTFAAPVAAFIIAGAAVAQSAPQPGAPPPPRPTADFARLPFLQDAEIAPGGKAIAARIAANGEQYLAVLPLDGSKPMVARGGQKLDINWFRWVNDDWLVAGLGSTTLFEGGEIYVTRLLRLKSDLSVLKLVNDRETAQFGAEVIWTARDGSARLLLARQTSIYVGSTGLYPEVVEVDVASGAITRSTGSRPGIWDWAADANGVVRVGWGRSDSGREQRLIYRSSASEPFREIDRANTRRGESLLSPLLFPTDGLPLVIQDDEQGFSALYEYNLGTMEPGKKLFGVPGYDIDMIHSDDTGTRLMAVTYVDTAQRTHWMDPEFASLQESLDKAVGPARCATIVSWSRDKVRLLVFVGSASEPGRYYVLDRTDGAMRPFGWVNDAIKGPLHPVQTIRYKARDVLEIPAVLILPKGRAAKRLPLIVMPHGGPWARDSESWDWWAQFMADRGYAVIQPNYRGSSGFGTSFAEAGHGEMGLKMQDDLNDAITHLAAEGIADPARVCMVGGSYGGYAAMRAAQRDGKLYRCAVSFAGVSDLDRLRAYDSRFLGGGYVVDKFRQQAPDLKAVSPLHFAAQVSIPILLVHGKEDKRVPINQSRLFAERLKAAGKDVTYIEQKLGDHVFSREADRLEFLQALETFLQTHNPAHSPADGGAPVVAGPAGAGRTGA
jgi:dipeptidyl aminopeptidase/acylaminoacyl peptidase